MGASLAAGGGGSGKRRRRRHKAPIADINMTPFIDVILCLLIIFMVAAPMMTGGVPLDLPKSAAGPLNSDRQPVEVSVKSDGSIYVGQAEVAPNEVVAKLTAIASGLDGMDERIFVRGDKASNYGQIMAVMGEISQAGFKRVALVTQPEK